MTTVQPIRRFLEVPASAEFQTPTRVEVIAGTSNRARDGHIVEIRGMDFSAFLRSGTILWCHDQKCPVGRPLTCQVDASGNLRVTIEFAPEGASETSDEVRALVKAGIVRNVSMSFLPLEQTPIDPRKPKAGSKISRSELWEVSFCSVPIDTGAVVTHRFNPNGDRILPDGTVLTEQAYQEWQHRRRCIAVMEMEQVELMREHAALPLRDYSFEARQRELRRLTPS